MYAKIVDNALQYPKASEFQGIPNYLFNDPALRRKHYMPLVGEAEPREGFTAAPATWHVVEQKETRTEPRREDPVTRKPFIEDVMMEDPVTHEQKKIGERRVTRDVPVEFDTSYIQVDTWTYTEIPVTPPAPDPEDITPQIQKLVEMIMFFANKYSATEELLSLSDVNIEALEALIDKYNVSADDRLTIMTKVQMRVLEIMATCHATWYDIWSSKVKPALTDALHPTTPEPEEPEPTVDPEANPSDPEQPTPEPTPSEEPAQPEQNPEQPAEETPETPDTPNA